MEKTNTRTWVEINTKAIHSNIKTLKKRLAKGTKFLAVVKGDAYGHGMLPVAKVAVASGADYLGVFDFNEAASLRKNKIKAPILVLRSITLEQIAVAITLNIEVCVSTIEMLAYFKKVKLSKPLRIHIMVDTGLGREGFRGEDMHMVIALLKKNKNISIVGLMTHFSGAESRSFDSYTVIQVDSLAQWDKHFFEAGIRPLVHASATAGVFLSKDFCLDMVRFGIGIYGLWPSEETQELGKGKTNLTPVLSWKTVIQEIKKLQAGSYIGYDLTHVLDRDRTVAILPIGYAEGYPRGASDKGFVLVRGRRARILGRVMMNMMVVDVTDIPNLKTGDVVTLVGKDGKESVSVEDVAMASGTINYEIVTRISQSVPRIYK